MHKDKLDLIKRAIPDIAITSTKFIESGHHSLAIIVNDEWVFRFPLDPSFYKEYIQEDKVLNLIKPHVKMQIPTLTIHNINDVLFTQHKIITGTQYIWIGSKMTFQQKELLAVDLANFMAQMHQVKTDMPVAQFAIDDYQIYQQETRFNEVFSRTEIEKLYRALSDFEKGTKGLNPNNAVLCHNDLNENNFLIEDGQLNGIIDFGNACVRDYSAELAALLKHDFKLTQKVAKHYKQISGKSVNFDYAVLIQKLRCYGGILEDSNNVERVNRYRRWLKHIEENNL